MGSERGSQTSCVERPPGILLVVDDPLEFDPVQLRRTVLEADRGDVRLRFDTIPQAAPVGPRAPRVLNRCHSNPLRKSTLHAPTDIFVTAKRSTGARRWDRREKPCASHRRRTY